MNLKTAAIVGAVAGALVLVGLTIFIFSTVISQATSCKPGGATAISFATIALNPVPQGGQYR